MSANRYQHGVTLIELIVFIVIVGVALAGVLTVLMQTTRNSADPMIRKQALAIAEAVLEEVMLQPFTWCDPDDPAAATVLNALGCTTAEGLGVEGAEARGTFDNVSDYNGPLNNGLLINTNIAGGGAAAYDARVVVEENSLNGIAATESLLITVTVDAPGEQIVLQGYRTRHSPNMLP